MRLKLLPLFRSIRLRLALLIVLAMAALIGYLVYDSVQERDDERQQAETDLQRLAVFADTAVRARFDATENFLNIVKQAQVLTTMAANPQDQQAYEACNRGLFVSDQLVPGTRFTLWDTSGNILCSSRGARPGDYSAADRPWFQQTRQRQGFATGGFEFLDNTDIPVLSFGIPISDQTNTVVAYLSGAVEVGKVDLLPAGESLPETGRLTVFDQEGRVINSTATDRQPGYQFANIPSSIYGLSDYLASTIVHGNGRTAAIVRATDNGDAFVGISVSGDTDALVTPLGEMLFRRLAPVALLTLIALVAIWLLGERWIVRPIEELGRASDALASGELEARAEVRSGVSELDRLAAKFNEMAALTERSSRAKDDFLGLISHELKTPITTALGNAEVLRNRGDRIDPEARQAALDDIHESTLRLSTIVDNLLALARLERGVGLESEPLLLLRLAEIAAEQEERAQGRRVAVRGDAHALALGGETWVQQILQNLIANALKYSPPDAPVEVRVEATPETVTARVLDRGWGIPAEEMAAVFEPFYRSERTRAAASGIGIGLSVCKRLVEAMGGEIWAKVRIDGGTEFGFSLPVAHIDEDRAPEAQPEAQPEAEPEAEPEAAASPQPATAGALPQ